MDEYLGSVSAERRNALERLRQTILKIIPDAEECISYGIPAFRIGGVVVAGFAATAKGCSYLPFSGSTLRTLAKDVREYEQTKSSLHFESDDRLPISLVRRLIKVRIAESENARTTSKRATRAR